jgi:hypothetical protein
MAIKFDEVLPEGEREGLAIPQQGFDLEQAKKTFNAYIAEIDDFVKQAAELTIETDEQNSMAVGMVTTSLGLIKKIKAQKEKIIREPKNYIDSVGNFANIFIKRLEVIKTALDDRITNYKHVREQKRREAEKKAIEEAAKLQDKLEKDAKKKGIEAPQVIPPIMPKEQKVVRTESGSASSRKVWTFEVVDMAKVPRTHLTLDEKQVRADIDAGIREIPGIKIFEKEKNVYRTY